MTLLQQFLSASTFAVLLVFCRIGTAMILLPGIGENYVSPRVRLLLAGAITLLVTPVVLPRLPPDPGSPGLLVVLIGGEMGIGLFIGTVARIMITTLETAGTLISFQIGLATANIFNPLLSDQGSLTSVLISITGIVVLFQTDMHHLMLRALVDSYSLFVPGALPPIGDFTEMISRLFSRSFMISLQLATPFLVIGLMMYVALGLISRLMPQLQIFFLALPLQMTLGFLLLVLTFSTLLLWFLNNFAEVMRGFVAPAGG